MRPTPLQRPDTKLASLARGLVSVALAATAMTLPAQTPLIGGQTLGTHGPFAAPWGVTFLKIKNAMESRLGGLAIQQIRRLRTVDPKTRAVSFPGTLESLRYRPGNNFGPYQFTLEFQGLEGRSLSPSKFAEEAKLFARSAGFSFLYRSFRISDPALANQHYNLRFLGHGSHATKQGPRPVYKMAVTPKAWDRASWLLELDVETGYPLYAGQYGFDASGGSRLEAEVIVKSFQTRMRFPQNTVWWAPTPVISSHATQLSALQTALSNKTHVVPEPLIQGYAPVRSEVHIDPYNGGKAAVLFYTDGLDHVFVRQENVTLRRRGTDDTVGYWNEGGMMSCQFSHQGVKFYLVGRGNAQSMRELTRKLYLRAIQTLK